jgi:hypothetical protein
VLFAPLILEDFPNIAPESQAELFDATEIDEILALRVRTLTDGEQAEARAADPRAGALLDAANSVDLGRLHGTFRQPFRLGDRVRVHPRAPAQADGRLVGTDCLDALLAGKTAVVAAIDETVDGETPRSWARVLTVARATGGS